MTLLKGVLLLVSLLNSLVRFLHDRSVFSAGQTQEAAEALRKAAEEVSVASGVQVAAKKQHDSDPTDNAFDNEFKRD